MANNPKLSNVGANAAADAMAALCNNGFLRIYSGTQATDADTAIGAQVLLAELRFAATAFGAANLGVATANPINDDTSANNTGTATWFRLRNGADTQTVADGSVGTSGADLNLNTTSIVAAAAVSVTSFTITQSKT
jgi:hypothetical protein